jgi:hypothetical protein
MNYAMTRHQFFSYLIPGFIFITLVFCVFNDWQIPSSHTFADIGSGLSAVFVLVWIIFSLFTGLVFDAIRNGFIEDHIENMKFLKKSKLSIHIDWDFLTKWGKEKEVKHFYDHYYTYYVFDFNNALTLILIILLIIYRLISCYHSEYIRTHIWALVIIIAVIIFFIIDAGSLRSEMHDMIEEKNQKKS